MQRPSTEDLTSVEWRDTNWIERVGGFQNQQMVLDYFSMSPFWDRQCNNQILSMQTQYNDLRQPYEATLEALRKMTGIEFAVIHEQPPVWVIQKRYRRGPEPNDVNPIATYYITGANVYQSPTIYSVIANRLLTSLFHVNSAFKETQKWMDFHPAKGYSWKSSKPTSTEKAKGQQGTLRARENQEFRHWMDRAIEASALRIAQNRFVPEQTVVANTPEVGSLTSVATSSQHNNREETGGKRQRKKTDEGNINKRKKKTASGK
ncbi:MED6 mediator sub complex component-domain-containing protein [Phascolomyces articulosus]|uniref:Mediator of RNA polymerase II transcription subunit 6 n=1 Tax=Phascolomyces articulosus TaxID=60185 RepID=A0AAD5JVP4_9FUNG|nr:MED6 mediator sub complex component-domain-containing protein [Phascolomyces articulosus]